MTNRENPLECINWTKPLSTSSKLRASADSFYSLSLFCCNVSTDVCGKRLHLQHSLLCCYKTFIELLPHWNMEFGVTWIFIPQSWPLIFSFRINNLFSPLRWEFCFCTDPTHALSAWALGIESRSSCLPSKYLTNGTVFPALNCYYFTFYSLPFLLFGFGVICWTMGKSPVAIPLKKNGSSPLATIAYSCSWRREGGFMSPSPICGGECRWAVLYRFVLLTTGCDSSIAMSLRQSHSTPPHPSALMNWVTFPGLWRGWH